MKTPNAYALVTGSAVHNHGNYPLVAFDMALQAAGIADTNLSRVSSILPPGAQQRPNLRHPGTERESVLTPGMLLPIAYGMEAAHNPTTPRPHDAPEPLPLLLVAAVAVGIPKDKTKPGVIVEDHARFDASHAYRHLRQLQFDDGDRGENTWANTRVEVAKEWYSTRVRVMVRHLMQARRLVGEEYQTMWAARAVEVPEGHSGAVIAACPLFWVTPVVRAEGRLTFPPLRVHAHLMIDASGAPCEIDGAALLREVNEALAPMTFGPRNISIRLADPEESP